MRADKAMTQAEIKDQKRIAAERKVRILQRWVAVMVVIYFTVMIAGFGTLIYFLMD